MNAQSSSMRRPPSDAAPTYRISPTREIGGAISVTVDTAQLLHVRRAIVQSGCDHVGIVKAVPLACGTRVRMLIAVHPDSMQRVMDSIMRTIGAGEFGRGVALPTRRIHVEVGDEAQPRGNKRRR